MNSILNRKFQLLILIGACLTLASGCSTVRLTPESASQWNSPKAVEAITRVCKDNFAGWIESGTSEPVQIDVDEQGFDIVTVLSSYTQNYGNYSHTHSTGKKCRLNYSDIDHVETRYKWGMLALDSACCFIFNPFLTDTVVVMKDGDRIKLNPREGITPFAFAPFWLFDPIYFTSKNERLAEAFEYMRVQAKIANR